MNELNEFSLIGFEVQQDIQKFANELKNKYPERNIDVYYSAVSNRDGTLQYFEPTKWGKNYKGGTTIVGSKQSMSVKYNEPKSAPSIDFSKWLFNNVTKDNFIFIKMDIEGAEYDVIENLIDTGAIDLVDILAVEWHAEKFSEPLRSKYLGIEKLIKKYAETNRVHVIDWY